MKSPSEEEAELKLDLDLSQLKAEVLSKSVEYQSRGLTHSFKWLSEILFAIR